MRRYIMAKPEATSDMIILVLLEISIDIYWSFLTKPLIHSHFVGYKIDAFNELTRIQRVLVKSLLNMEWTIKGMERAMGTLVL